VCSKSRVNIYLFIQLVLLFVANICEDK